MSDDRTLQSKNPWFSRGLTLLESAAYREALAAFDRAIDENTELAEAYLFRGVCRYKLGHFRQAAADMDAATLLGCEDAQLWSRFCPRDADFEAEEKDDEPGSAGPFSE